MSRMLLKDDIILFREDGSSVKFHIKTHIGSGASCVVYRVVCDDNTEHLLKEYYPRNLDLKRNRDGAIVVPSHKRENFNAGLLRFREGAERQKNIRVLDVSKNVTSNIQGYLYGNGTEYIDMTVFSGCTYDEVKDESLYDMMRRMRALAHIVGCYHDARILHLDIKPQNIFAIPETPEMVMMFDFDSATKKDDILSISSMSYTKDWAAPEQLLPYKRNAICEATDLFSVGEIIFTKIFGRHSTQAERRSFAEYDIDYKADVFKNTNPKVVPLVKELFRHTLCAVPSRRYQTAGALIEQLDKIIKLAHPEKQFLISNPINPKDGFIGRDSEMQDIHTRLQQCPILFLHGIGGIGKSELAKQYATRYKSEYDIVLFAPYTTDMVSLITSDSSIQINNFSRYMDETAEEYCDRKLQKIKELIANKGERILLIVDNLDDEKDKNIRILFELGCRVLLTTRADIGKVFNRPQMEIEAFKDRAVSKKLFRKYYKFSDDEFADVDAIIDLVQGHTLAIELIAKQIDAEWSTVQEIREKLESGGLSSIGDEDVDSVKDDNLSQDSAFGHIKALFDLSVFEKENREHELYVLANLSLVPFTGIDRKLFEKWCDLANHGGKDCVKRLVKSGWIYQEECISLHPLVAEVVMDMRNYEKNVTVFLKHYAVDLKLWLWEPLESSKKAILCACAHKIVHMASKRMASGCLIQTKLMADILRKISELFTQMLFNPRKAMQVISLVNNIVESIEDYPQEDRLDIKGDYGVICDSLGDVEQDDAWHKKAIEIYSEILSDPSLSIMDNDFIATIEQNMACAYDSIYEFDSALGHFQKAIDIRNNEPKGDENSSKLALLYNNVGYMYKMQAKYTMAIEYYEKALPLARDGERLAKIYHDLGWALIEKAPPDYELAMQYAEYSIRMRKVSNDETSFTLAMSKHLLGKILLSHKDKHNFTEAIQLLEEAKDVYLSVLGPAHKYTQQVVELLDSTKS